MNSHDGKTDNQIAYILTERCLSSKLDARTFREADCDTNQWQSRGETQ